MEAAVELRVLGAVLARPETGPANLGHARRRSVLAVLLAEPNEPHPIHRLATWAWGNRQPHRTRITLSGYLHRLRRALTSSKPRIVRADGGDALEVDATAVDLHRFRSLVRRVWAADAEQVYALLSDALDLGRDDALTGVESPSPDQVRHIPGRERTDICLHRNGLDLLLGLHHALLAEVSVPAGADLSDERLTGHLMLILYRCGRQAEALHHFQRMRRAVADEFGVRPNLVRQQVGLCCPTEDVRRSRVADLPLPSSALRRAVHRSILVVDVEGFGDRHRTNHDQLAVRAGLYRALQSAFSQAGVPWARCHREDRGDGVFMLVPPEVPKAVLVEPLPTALAAAIRDHNGTCKAGEQFRLRMALHAGEVNYDKHGVTSTAVNHTFRLSDAIAIKDALAGSPGVLALITSDWFYEEVVRHSQRIDPGTFRPFQIMVKETQATGWVGLPDVPYREGSPAR
jgi:DNA-binding SARP family transcriptional activator